MKTIFDKTPLGKLEVKNRIVSAATGHNLTDEIGHIPKELFEVYRELAEGGSGFILLEFTSVAAVDHFSSGLMRLHRDDLIPEYKKLAEMIHGYNAIVMPQLAMGIYLKKNSRGQWVQAAPDNMTKEDVQDIIDKFVSTAIRAKQAGFDGVQLHGAHGFVLSTFLSPAYNHRGDSYGGSMEARSKIVIDIIHGIKEKCGDFHISIKINSSDFMRGGLTPEESLEICQLLEKEGLDSIEVSGMGPCVDEILPGESEGFFAPYSKVLKQLVSIPVILTGGHRSVEHMEQLLAEDATDFFSISRPLVREPGL
ncbi:MAG: NADH:flavin oxidoreductase, partial [Lachnospiraceae bacterium]|nr:NADH:flavin oxidoreductase [Lachnospiraceae bacterium]